MNIPRLIATLVFLVFFIFSTWVTLKAGYLSAFPPFPDLNTTQIFWDLTISLNIILYLAYQLFKERNLALWPLGVFLLPQYLIDHANKHRVSIVELPLQKLTFPIYICHLKSDFTPTKIQCFSKFLRENLKDKR